MKRISFKDSGGLNLTQGAAEVQHVCDECGLPPMARSADQDIHGATDVICSSHK